MTDRPHISAIRARASAATFGPWEWRGDTKHQRIELVTRNRGRVYVMGFRRWGTQRAQPTFQLRTNGNGAMTPASQMPVWEVAPDAVSPADPRLYRHDIIGIRHPDAVFIAHSRQDVDDLLTYIDRLEAQVPR